MTKLTELDSWTQLQKHSKSLHLYNPLDSNQSSCSGRFQLSSNAIDLDFSHQLIDETTFDLLIKLANECALPQKIEALFRGDKINQHENRPALHTALRSFDNKAIMVDGSDIMPDVLEARDKIWLISTQIRENQWLGYSGKPITSIVNIGMGGCDLGARFCLNALSEYQAKHLTYHFVSDVDPNSFEDVVTHLKPETTLFIIASKSFTTEETLYNARKAFAWIGHRKRHPKHIIAITSNSHRALELGIKTILPIWEWIGGRYSLCSAINLITCIAVGFERFTELLAGANSLDRHFHHSPLDENLPVIMALLGIWNINFLHISNMLLLVYAKQLEKFIPYIQQLDMESNGKSFDNDGRSVNYSTGPIVWGGLGNQAQHSYHQLLYQGTHKIAADFISIRTFDDEFINALCHTNIDILTNGVANFRADHYIRGKMPINHIRLLTCSPFNIGSLIALYEHKIFTQGVIWNINSFNQPGVDSARRCYRYSENNLNGAQVDII